MALLRWGRFKSRNFLYRTLGLAVILTLCSAVVLRSEAQEDRPQINPQRNRPQDNKKPKKGKEPRAIGVLQFNKAGKATLTPVAILIDGKFYDADEYKADPVPMALERGTVYEAVKEGDSQGLFTVNAALHGTSAGTSHSWIGSGTFAPQGSETPKTSHKAENVPVGIDSSGDEPPRLVRKGGSSSSNPDSSSAPGTDSGDKTSGTAPASDKPASSDKPAAKDDKPQTSAPQTGSDKGASSSPSGTAGSDGSSGDYYRPTLRRGKPTEPAPAEEASTVKPVGKTETAGATPNPTSPAAEAERTVAAISDAAGPEPQSYKFFWKTGEEDERRKQLTTYAAEEVRRYVEMRAKSVISAKAAPKPTPGAHKPVAAKLPLPILENIQLRTFDVWLTNQPVMVLSAEAHMPPATGAAGAAAPPLIYSITLVARTDIYGDLVKVHSAVTDKFHLDVTPRLELIDAVDADGDGRGELLFRETSDAGSGYVIYRATADKLWKMFDSLKAE